MTDARERRWIDAAREGDQAAFEELVRLYEKRVLALTQRMCRNSEDAAEAAQEAFFAAWRGLKDFRGESSFSTWIYRLASNACVDLLRREGRHQAAVSLDDGGAGLVSRRGSRPPRRRRSAGSWGNRSRRGSGPCRRSTGPYWCCGRSSSCGMTRSPGRWGWTWGR